MKPCLLFIKWSFVVFFAICIACSSPSEVDVDQSDIKSSSVAVIDISGKSTIPTQYRIDGRLSSNNAQTIGRGDVEAPYVPVEAGLRKLSIGSYQDTLHIKESNYYTVMVYDNDSIQLSLDAPYASNQFTAGPQIRWSIANEPAGSYRVDIKSDTLLMKDVSVNHFTPTLFEEEAIVFLYERGIEKVLKQVLVPTKVNRKETVRFSKNPSTNEFAVEIVSQQVKL